MQHFPGLHKCTKPTFCPGDQADVTSLKNKSTDYKISRTCQGRVCITKSFCHPEKQQFFFSWAFTKRADNTIGQWVRWTERALIWGAAEEASISVTQEGLLVSVIIWWLNGSTQSRSVESNTNSILMVIGTEAKPLIAASWRLMLTFSSN